MSVDLGSEWMKVAVVSPGVPMEIVLNGDSQRKTPTIIAFREGERQMGESAAATATRFPEKSFSYLLDLLGKRLNSSSVQRYQRLFPYANIVANPDDSGIYIIHPDGQKFSPEELIAMFLKRAKQFAERSSGQVKNC